MASFSGIVLSLFKILKTQDWINFLRVDLVTTCEAGGFRAGLELLRIRRNNVGWVNDPDNENPVMKITLLQTKKR